MAGLAPVLSNLAGKNPSQRVESLLMPWMLPGEPIVGALHGTVRLQPAWLILTETVVLQVRDGMSTTIEAIVPVTEVTGYQEAPGWGSTKFHLGTTSGQISLDQVKSQYTVSFVHAVERVLGGLGPSGVPTLIHPVVAGLEDLESALTILFQDRELAALAGERSPLECALAEFGVPFAAGIDQPSNEGYGCILLLWMLSMFQGVNQPRWPAAQQFWSWARTLSESQPLLKIHDSLPSPNRQPWDQALNACGTALEAAAYLLASRRARAALLDTAADYRSRIGASDGRRGEIEMGQSNKADHAPQSHDADLLGKFERLAELHRSGALDDDEYATLKRALLGGL